MIVYACPNCGRQIEVEDARAGAQQQCPGCGMTAAVPPAAAKTQAPSATSETVSLASGVPLASASSGVETGASEKRPAGHPPEWTEFLAPAQAPDDIGRCPTGTLRKPGPGSELR